MGSKTLIEKLFLDRRREERVGTEGGKNAAAGEKAEGALLVACVFTTMTWASPI